jgi:toxin ParE1/3/4
MTISISPLARQDLEEIWFYTYNTWSYNQANKYQDELFNGFALIAKDYLIGKSYHTIKPGYRMLKVNHHYIFYVRNGDTLTIMRVLHEKIELPLHLQ